MKASAVEAEPRRMVVLARTLRGTRDSSLSLSCWLLVRLWSICSCAAFFPYLEKRTAGRISSSMAGKADSTRKAVVNPPTVYSTPPSGGPRMKPRPTAISCQARASVRLWSSRLSTSRARVATLSQAEPRPCSARLRMKVRGLLASPNQAAPPARPARPRQVMRTRPTLEHTNPQSGLVIMVVRGKVANIIPTVDESISYSLCAYCGKNGATFAIIMYPQKATAHAA
mmetsp:Transcript_13252/g.19534  ORF Transcript_13252/g.19534 Transcript_13252/m.19534 type:complete len:227 (+) Transcript_13252:258-938(+)